MINPYYFDVGISLDESIKKSDFVKRDLFQKGYERLMRYIMLDNCSIIAMAVAAIAEEERIDANRVVVISFREISKRNYESEEKEQ